MRARERETCNGTAFSKAVRNGLNSVYRFLSFITKINVQWQLFSNFVASCFMRIFRFVRLGSAAACSGPEAHSVTSWYGLRLAILIATNVPPDT